MSLRRFLVPPESLQEDLVELPPDEAAHARRVLRLAAGEEVWLLDGEGRQARCRVESVSKASLTCRVLEIHRAETPSPRLVICPGLAKNPAMDLIAVKLTELMADQVRPIVCRRSVARPAKSADRLDRWRRLAGQALKQCGAPKTPSFFPPVSLEELIGQTPAQAVKIMLYEDEEETSLAQALAKKPERGEVWALVGPEGGFSKEEARLAQSAGFTTCGLPHAILRSETACLALAAVVRFGMV